MLENIQLNKIFFLDIETVPLCPEYKDMDEVFKTLWDEKAEKLTNNYPDQSPEDLFNRAGIYSEFGKVICISIGLLKKNENQFQFRVKSFYGDDERKILEDFINLINSHYKIGQNFLCAHNGKEFDFPYLARRMIINNLKLPAPLDVAGKKPWETDHLLDTMQIWKFGDYKSYTSLNLLCAVLNIPTPKDDIKGSDVYHVYWNEKDLTRIVKYCEKDVLAVARLIMKFKGIEIIKDDNIVELTN